MDFRTEKSLNEYLCKEFFPFLLLTKQKDFLTFYTTLIIEELK
jgi:hypothetical protein